MMPDDGRSPIRPLLIPLLVLVLAHSTSFPAARSSSGDLAGAGARLIGRMLGPSPMAGDLRFLCDRIGGRPTGGAACEEAVDWFVDRFRDAGVDRVSTESFTMPRRWEEGRSRARIAAPDSIPLSVAAMPFSATTPAGGLEAPIVDLGDGSPIEFERAGDSVRGGFVLIGSELLVSLEGLFNDYLRLPPIVERAVAAGAAGLLQIGGRAHGMLYRHLATFDLSPAPIPMAILGREDGLRVARLAAGEKVRLDLDLDITFGPAYQARNVVAEITGSDRADEIVVAGAHLDSWGLGTGALDNGANCVMLLNLARQMVALGASPRRTIRFVLFTGEEEGLVGSREYVRAHRATLDQFAGVVIFDLGTGRVEGFSMGGREELRPLVVDALRPVAGYGVTRHTTDAFVGTDNFDFLLEGVPNLVANQAPANYLEHYHASSDTYDKAALDELAINGAIAAAIVWRLANAPDRAPRQDRAAVRTLLESTGLVEQMKTFGLYGAWEERSRGRRD